MNPGRGPGTTQSKSSDFMIRVTSYEDRIMNGSLEHSATGDSLVFCGLMDLINAIQYKLDEINFPQSTMALRQWELSDADTDELPVLIEEDYTVPAPDTFGRALSCFMLRIQFRQNASWQGNLAWLDEKKAIAFRSVLELTRLIDSAIQYSAGRNAVIPVTRPEHRWKAKESVI